MTYTLIIGEEVFESNGYTPYVSAKVVTHEDTGDTNQRCVSEVEWRQAMETLGLTDMIYGHDYGYGGGDFVWNGQLHFALMWESPGFVAITSAHVDAARNTVAAYRNLNPGNSSEQDSALAHGEWLVYWLQWAIDNCQRPMFVNRLLVPLRW